MTTVTSTGDLSLAFSFASENLGFAKEGASLFFTEHYQALLRELPGLTLTGSATAASAVLASGAVVTLSGTNLGNKTGAGDWGISSLTITDRTDHLTLQGAMPFDGSDFTGPESLTYVEVMTNLGTQAITGTGLDIDGGDSGLSFSAGTITSEKVSVGIFSLTLTGVVDASSGAGDYTTLRLAGGVNSVTATGLYDAPNLSAAVADAVYLGWLFQASPADSTLLFSGNDTLNVSGPTTWFGFAGNDVITGDSGSNTLDGGAGADTLTGGGGNDTYIVDNVGDVVAAGDDFETVRSSIDYVLASGLDNLVLTGAADLTGTGNSGANTLIGNGGSNTLDGGAGVDVLIGGGGNDTYIVDSASDVVSAGAGIDTVKAGYSYTLGANQENLLLTGSAPVNGTGNAR
ncbi:MAG TPA: hypothetical protein VEF76_00230 [Patescibacteria group bacterium]|nr:hypothetical protein [Patescibacteria group bacterium]